MQTVIYTLNKQDVSHFIAAHIKKYPKQYWPAFALSLCFLLFGGYVIHLTHKIDLYSCFFLAVGIVYIPFVIKIAANTTYKMIQPNAESKLLLDENGVEYQSELISTSKYEWKSIKEIQQTKDVYLFWITDRMAHIVPKRIFDNECQSESFYKQAMEYYNKM